jgi:hypothetical protein
MKIEKFTGNNMMGFQRLSLIKTADVASISRPVDNQVTVTLKGGREWNEIYFTPETGQMQVNPQEDDAGEYFKISASVSVPKVQALSLKILQAFRYRKMLLMITNNNGENWLMGTLEQPAKMLYNTNQSWNTTNAIEVEFLVAESDTHPYLVEETVSGGAFSDGFSNGFAI